MNRSFESFLGELFLTTNEVSNYYSICSYNLLYENFVRPVPSWRRSDICDVSLYVTTARRQNSCSLYAIAALYFFLEGIMRAHAAIKYCIYPATLPSVTVKQAAGAWR
jgi:hypothetical protein